MQHVEASPLYFGSYDGSVVLAAQEGRDIENVFINRIAHGRGTAVRIEALQRRRASGVARHFAAHAGKEQRLAQTA
jgi:hypothetical protein